MSVFEKINLTVGVLFLLSMVTASVTERSIGHDGIIDAIFGIAAVTTLLCISYGIGAAMYVLWS